MRRIRILGIAMVAILITGMIVMSCEKESSIIEEEVTAKLTFDDFELGVPYKLSDIDQSVLQALEIDPTRKARGVSYRTRAWHFYAGEPTLTNVNLNINGSNINLTSFTPREVNALNFTNIINQDWTYTFSTSGSGYWAGTAYLKTYEVDGGVFTLVDSETQNLGSYSPGPVTLNNSW